MPIVLEWLLVYLILGAGVGLFAGLLGVGGGAIMVPFLTAFFLAQNLESSHAVYLALGTSMASIIVTSVSSMYAHHRHQAVLWPVVKMMVPGILAGAYIVTFIVPFIDSRWLALLFSIFIGYISVQMLSNRRPKPGRQVPGVAGLMAAGATIGGFSALVSIGGGTLTTPFLIWSNVELRRAIGTSAAVGVPISLAGTLGYLLNGKGLPETLLYVTGFVYWPAVICISLVSVFMAPVGARLTSTLPVSTVRTLFAAMLVFLSIDMIVTVVL